MPYSICGLIIHQSEERACSGRKFPLVTLEGGVSLIPLDRDYLLLIDGDDTAPRVDFEFTAPEWLLEMADCFSKCAYIEAEFWGGTGMQACIVFEKRGTVSEPVISLGAINFALLHMGIDDSSGSSFGVKIRGGKDPFDVVGLGRQRSVGAWLQEAHRPTSTSSGDRATD